MTYSRFTLGMSDEERHSWWISQSEIEPSKYEQLGKATTKTSTGFTADKRKTGRRRMGTYQGDDICGEWYNQAHYMGRSRLG